MTWNPSLCVQASTDAGYFVVVPNPAPPELQAYFTDPWPDGVPVLAGPDGSCCCLRFEDEAEAKAALPGLWSDEGAV